MAQHPVRKANLSEDHVEAFERLARNDVTGGIDESLIADLKRKFLVETDEIGNTRIPMAVYMEWVNSEDEEQLETVTT